MMRGMIVAVALIVAIGAALASMFSLPGKSYRGPLKALTPDEAQIASNLRHHVVAIASREHNLFKPAALEASARYIEAELEQIGYTVQTQPFDTPQGRARNIEAVMGPPDGISIVVGAHYDSVMGSPGANDNASGVAATLEIARLMRSATPARTFRFVLFVNEEPPFFRGEDMGSRRYVRRLQSDRIDVAAMFSIETVGYYSDAPDSQRYPPPLALLYPDVGNFIGFVANLASRDLLRRAVEAFRKHTSFPSEGVAAPAFVPGVDWSDHASFWEAGYPALMITDTAPFRYPHYHLPTDTPEKVDYERLARLVAGLDAMLRELFVSPAR